MILLSAFPFCQDRFSPYQKATWTSVNGNKQDLVKCSYGKYGGSWSPLPSQGENTMFLMLLILWCGEVLQSLEFRGPSHGWEVVWMIKLVPSTVKVLQIGTFFQAQWVLGLDPILKRKKEKFFHSYTRRKINTLSLCGPFSFFCFFQAFFPHQTFPFF